MADTPTTPTTPTTTTDPVIPIVKKVTFTPIQQRIPAVSSDGTLSIQLQGEINRLQKALTDASNYNADTITLIVQTLANYNIIVKRVGDIEASQKAVAAESSLVNSYTDPTSVLMTQLETGGTTASVTVQNHNRIYADGTTTAIIGSTVTGLPLSTVIYFYYDDATRAGGAVSIQHSTNNLDAAQTGIRHSLGYISTPATGTTGSTSGGGVTPTGANVPPRKYQGDDPDLVTD